MDLDDLVEEKAGKSVREVFAENGEGAFRSLELNTLRDILATEYEGVLALGGGTVMTPECAEMAKEKTLCIYLKASVDTLMKHLANEVEKRPLLATSTDPHLRIVELVSQRSSTYEKTANIIIDIDDKSIEQICSEIKNRI